MENTVRSQQSGSGGVGERVEEARHKAEQVVDTTKAKAAEVSAQTADRIDSAMTNAGQQMSSLAQTVRERAPEGRLGDVAYSAASALERSGSYLQQSNVDTIRGDLEITIRRHPVESLLVGLGVGFLLARSMRR